MHDLRETSETSYMLGRHAATLEHHDKRITRLERQPKRKWRTSELIQIGLGFVGLLWAISGRISWSEWLGLLMKSGG